MSKKNPIEEAIRAGALVKSAARRKEEELWQVWKDDKNADNMNRLLKRFNPVLSQGLQQYKAPQVDEAAMKAKLKIQAVEAFETYNPNKGAALKTHVQNKLKGAIRFNTQHQNYGYLPEDQVKFISPIDRASDDLRELNGREPSYTEISDYANTNNLVSGSKKLTSRMVARVQGNRRNDIIASSMESDPSGNSIDRNRAILPLIRYELTSDQQQVFDHLYGHNGAVRIASTGALAKKLGKSASQISRLRSAIGRVYKKHL